MEQANYIYKGFVCIHKGSNVKRWCFINGSDTVFEWYLNIYNRSIHNPVVNLGKKNEIST